MCQILCGGIGLLDHYNDPGVAIFYGVVIGALSRCILLIGICAGIQQELDHLHSADIQCFVVEDREKAGRVNANEPIGLCPAKRGLIEVIIAAPVFEVCVGK